MPDFLLELFTEEIPARMQARACDDLRTAFVRAMEAAGVAFGAVEAHGTPRRLALIVSDMAEATAATSEERRGPRADAPEAAVAGFLKSTGLTREQLVTREDPKGRFLYAVIERPGRATADVLAEAVPAIVRAFPWPKSMRWGAASASTASLRWVRPLVSIAALLGDEVVPVEVDGIRAGRTTRGHRFMGPDVPISIERPGTYAAQLREAFVILSAEERRAIIRDRAEALAAEAGLALIPDEGLLAENAGLTEWPVPLLGRFERTFLEVPREVIQLTMRANQKYFALSDPSSGGLAPAFICVANLEAGDGGAAIVAGNRKVLAARLSDARFFWEQDKAVKLEDRLPKLKEIVFHEKLGTVADKVDRVAKLARWLVESGAIRVGSPPHAVTPAEAGVCSVDAGGATSSPAQTPASAGVTGLEAERARVAALAEQAARLCKADLVTGMVGEFPELQGVMGDYYARADGLPSQVADAIRDHYKPVGQGDEVPTAPVTVAVSLADKLDTLISFFGIKEKPTGSRDPYALRRAAIGALDLIVSNNIRLSLTNLLAAERGDEAIRKEPLYKRVTELMKLKIEVEEVLTFFADRLKVQQREAGVRHDLIDAVFALGGEDDLVRLLARVRALQAFFSTEDGANLLAGYRRAVNIVRIEEKKGGWSDGPIDPALLHEPEERALAHAVDAAIERSAAAVAAEDFEGAMAALAALRAPVDAFFDRVTVNASETNLRENRLRLLNRIRAAAHTVADFGKIEG